jgi:uncharacterized protein (TIGR03437 family)
MFAQARRVPDALRSLAAPAPVSLGPLAQRPASNRRALLIGTQRAVPPNALRPAISRAADGRSILTASLTSPGAVRLRVHFRYFDAGAGEVWLYGPGGDTGAGPYTGQGILDSGEFWSAGVESATVVVAFMAAPGTSSAEFPFTIDAVAHEWSSPTASTGSNAAAASCEQDVTCSPQYATQASAVGRIEFRGDDANFYLCSGSMVGTTSGSQKPFFLTANHCISSNTEAQSVQAWFLYRTKTCGGPPPDISTVPFIQAATYVAGAPIPNGDYSLILFKQNAPAGVAFLPPSATLGSGAPVVGIHYPQGDYERISFGNRTADAETFIGSVEAPAPDYYQVTWSSGVVEEGSSGSPLLDQSTGNLVGTLTGGPALSGNETACTAPHTAIYARFSDAATALSPYLNDTSSTLSASPSSLNFQSTDGAGALTRAVAISTLSTSAVTFTAATNQPWLKVSTGGSVSAAAPASATVSIDPAVLNTPGSFFGVVTFTPAAGGALSLLVTASVGFSRSVVTLAVAPNPVFEQVVSGQNRWPYTLTVTESAGAAIQLTAFKVNGVGAPSTIQSYFGTDTMAGLSSLGTSLYADSTLIPAPPLLRTFEIDGMDTATGRTWQVTTTVPFLGPYAGPAVGLIAAPATIYQNPDSSAACQWTENLIVSETAGYPALLTKLTADSGDLTNELAKDFGTVRLPANGSLLGSLCFQTQPSVGVVQLNATDDYGNGVISAASATFRGRQTSPPKLTVSPAQAALTTSSPSAQLTLDFGGAATAWNATMVSQYDASWLSTNPTPLKGTGGGKITVTANPAGLASGYYSATLLIQAQEAWPQAVAVPVSLQVGPASPKPTIFSGGLTNAWDVLHGGIAPGSVISIWGANLATGVAVTPTVPFVNRLSGTVVTINGIQAPLYYVSSGQLNVQVPFEVAPGPAQVVVTVNGQSSGAATMQVQAVAPGICGDFTAAPRLCIDSSGSVGDYKVVYVTGQGAVSPAVSTGAAPFASSGINDLPRPSQQTVAVTVGGVPATILFAGIPSWAVAVLEIDFVVPAVAPGDHPVVVTIGAQSTAPATFTVLP